MIYFTCNYNNNFTIMYMYCIFSSRPFQGSSQYDCVHFLLFVCTCVCVFCWVKTPVILPLSHTHTRAHIFSRGHALFRIKWIQLALWFYYHVILFCCSQFMYELLLIEALSWGSGVWPLQNWNNLIIFHSGWKIIRVYNLGTVSK